MRCAKCGKEVDWVDPEYGLCLDCYNEKVIEEEKPMPKSINELNANC